MSDYTLEIISHHSQFKNKSLKKYNVEGIETIGVWGDEPFEIRFKNNTWQKIQVKISLDGTDIYTGKPADTEVSSDMWVVEALQTLSLKAWPETNNGGAQFVFTNADKSVAVHTHGDLSSRGIIAAAVFVEGHVEPINLSRYIQEHHHHHHYPKYPVYDPYWYTYTTDNTFGAISTNDCYYGSAGGSNTITASEVNTTVNNISELVAIGAGDHIDQKIVYTTGLNKPVFRESIRVKYVWWDDLVAKLRTDDSSSKPQPSGFPGDRKEKNIDLKDTPRITKMEEAFKRIHQQQMYARV